MIVERTVIEMEIDLRELNENCQVPQTMRKHFWENEGGVDPLCQDLFLDSDEEKKDIGFFCLAGFCFLVPSCLIAIYLHTVSGRASLVTVLCAGLLAGGIYLTLTGLTSWYKRSQKSGGEYQQASEDFAEALGEYYDIMGMTPEQVAILGGPELRCKSEAHLVMLAKARIRTGMIPWDNAINIEGLVEKDKSCGDVFADALKVFGTLGVAPTASWDHYFYKAYHELHPQVATDEPKA